MGGGGGIDESSNWVIGPGGVKAYYPVKEQTDVEIASNGERLIW